MPAEYVPAVPNGRLLEAVADMWDDIQQMDKGFEDEFKFEERTKSVSPEKKAHKSLQRSD